jgi:hypothetical protein
MLTAGGMIISLPPAVHIFYSNVRWTVVSWPSPLATASRLWR